MRKWWISTENNCHINCYSFKSELSMIMGFMWRNFSDISTAIACINKLGASHSELCHHVTKQILECAEKKDIHITTSHITGHKNINVDRKFRDFSCDLEWMVSPKSLHKVLKVLNFNLEVYSFASNIKYKFRSYFSNKVDPNVKAVDSFAITWHSLKLYAFLLLRFLEHWKKNKAKKAECILVVLLLVKSSVVLLVV